MRDLQAPRESPLTVGLVTCLVIQTFVASQLILDLVPQGHCVTSLEHKKDMTTYYLHVIMCDHHSSPI